MYCWPYKLKDWQGHGLTCHTGSALHAVRVMHHERPQKNWIDQSADPDTGEQLADARGKDLDENYYGETSAGDYFEDNNQAKFDSADRESSPPSHETDDDSLYLNLAIPLTQTHQLPQTVHRDGPSLLHCLLHILHLLPNTNTS